MKSKMMISLLIIAMAAAVIGGSTMAWFTAQSGDIENTFTAGTLMIDVDEDVNYDVTLNMNNVNPGDCFEKEFNIENTGTKGALLRMELDEEWVFDYGHLWNNWEALGFTELNPLNGGGEKPAAMSGAQWDAFVAYVEGLPNPVKWTELEAQLVAADWLKHTDGYWYYNDKLASTSTLTFAFDVCFDGVKMTNPFQAVEYTLTINFEAIQASNNASGNLWLVDSVYDPADPQSSTNWDRFNF